MALSYRAPARGGLMGWRVASAVLLLAMAGIHVYLVLFAGFDGLLVTRGRLLALSSVLSLLFLGGTLLALVLALTPAGVMGMHETIDAELVPTTLVAESLGVVVLAITTVLVLRRRTRPDPATTAHRRSNRRRGDEHAARVAHRQSQPDHLGDASQQAGFRAET